MVLAIFIVTLLVCVLLGIAMAVWADDANSDAWYLQLHNTDEDYAGYFNPDKPFLVALIGFGTWMVLQAYMIPLSLYVTLEVNKLMVATWVGWDLKMYSAALDKRAECKNSSVIEELGQVQYILSDKTGTLTQNKMALLKLTAGTGRVFGSGCTEIDIKIAELKGLVPPTRGPPVDPNNENLLFHDEMVR